MKYCSFCGNVLTRKILLDGTQEQYCLTCDKVFFDSPSPAIIVAVMNNEQIILTRSIEWTHQYWGLIAGHIKSGETAEEAAVREVREEVDITVNALTLLKTFAHRSNLLMIGFKAETMNTVLTPSPELEQAAWFHIGDYLPLRPRSIAYQIVKTLYPDMRHKTINAL